MAFKVELDHDGLAELLKSGEVQAVIHDLAEGVAADVRAQTGLEVVVDDYTTDRAASSVTIKDRRGREFEIRDGVLTKAAARKGLEVHSKGGDDG